MAGNYTVDVSVALKAQQASIKNIRKQIETEFGEVDFNSSVGKKLSKLFDQFDNRISNMDSILGKGVLNASDLNKLGTLFDSMNLIVGQMRSAAGKAPLMDLGIDPNEVPEIVAAMKELQKVRAKISAEENQSSKEALKAMNKEKTLERMKELEGSKSSEDKSLRENERIIEAEYKQRKAAQEKLQQELDSLEAKRKSKLQEQAIEEQKARDTRAAAQAKQLEAKEKKLVEKNAIKKIKTEQGKTFKDQQKNINDFINQVYSDGAIAAEAHLKSSGLAGSLMRALFSDDEMDALAGQSAEKFRQAFQAKLFENGGKSINQQNLDTVINTTQEWGRNNPETSAQAQRTANVLQQQVSQHELNSQNAGIEANAIQTEIEGKTQELNNLSVEVAKFSAVVSELSNAASELRASVDSKYRDELNKAQKGLQGAQQNARMNMIPSTEPGNQAFQREGVDSGLNSINMAQEADSFAARMKQGIKQWMGAREVIGYIKQGIRSAYQDIQGLDKAMTNIAVVTDMSTSDLWGKIDQYMGMAQKYGVTTQGVYEVSQLFFQQGLGENDTMEATVETLKMARIAGMDYKDAADGMTVAIRGFNMEMSEAAHVTDVYSKVAAITASDTQELVKAMSKTASSAASVGSSFENTTAMLAVMVEATRESPQNIGSAMKSIISRYGEMTKGLSEDSEGEEIDYNRVDTALKSIGISIKDAQGQFRDFDDVIFELADKWDTLDSVTQRYIATIFAGNRQQSRFLALVSNADRLQEVSNAAANSEDAGLLQYSKTMDSLETKTNNIKTSFQQFYMDIFNGPLIGKGLDFINDIIKGFNKLGKLTSVMNIASMIMGVKALVNLLVQPFSQVGNIISRSIEEGMRKGFANARAYGEQGGREMGEGVEDGLSSSGGGARGFFEDHMGEIASVAQIAGGALSALGSRVASSGTSQNADRRLMAGSWLSAGGNFLSAAGTGASIGMAFGPWGAAIGAVVGGLGSIISTIISWPDELDRAQARLEKAEEEAQDAQVKRAEAVQRESDLEATIEKLNELKKHQYDSAEAQEEFIKANNEAFEKFPELAATFDEAGNAIIDVSSAEQALALARDASANATLNAMQAELTLLREKQKTAKVEHKADMEAIETRYSSGDYARGDEGEDFIVEVRKNYEQSVNEVRKADIKDKIKENMLLQRQQEAIASGIDPAAIASGAITVSDSEVEAEYDRIKGTDEYKRLKREVVDEKVALKNEASFMQFAENLDMEETEFLRSLLGEYYTEDDVRDRTAEWDGVSKGLKANAFNIYDAATDTYTQSSEASLTFLDNVLNGLNLEDTNTRNFVEALMRTSSNEDALSLILSQYHGLSWEEGLVGRDEVMKALGYNPSDEDEIKAFNQAVGKNNEYIQQQVALGNSIEAVSGSLINYNVNSAIDNDASTKKKVDSITGARAYLQEKTKQAIEEDPLIDAELVDYGTTVNKMQELIGDYENFQFKAQALGLTGDVSDLNQLALSGKISRNAYLARMNELGMTDPGNEGFIQDFADTTLFGDSNETRLNASQVMRESSVNWRAAFDVLNGELAENNILNDIADNYISEFTAFNNYLVKKMDNGEMDQRSADQMAREYLDVWEASANLPTEQIAEAQRLIAEADLTTTMGKEELKAQLEDAGIYSEDLTGKIDSVYAYSENLITQYGQLEDKLIKNLETLTEAIQGAAEGMELSEASKIAEKLGKDIFEVFNFQDGKYVAKDANVLSDIQELYTSEAKTKMQESLQNQLDILNETPVEETYWVEEDGHLVPQTRLQEDYHSEEYKQLIKQYQDPAEAWFAELERTGQLETEGLTTESNTNEIIQAYLIDLQEDTENAIDEQTRWIVEQAQQALDITNRTFELEGGINGRNKREAFDLLANNGLTGYSAEQIAQLETYLGVGADGLHASETGIGTGEYRISRRALEGLNLPTWVQDGINAQIEEQVQSAKTGLEDVMSSVASGEGLTDTQLKQLLGEEFEGIPDTIAHAYQGAMQTAMETGNFGHLENILKTVYESKGSEEADKLAKESIARFKDQIEESREEIIDLSISALEGDISAEDALKLGAQGINVDGLINRTQEAISTLVQSIVDNTDISFGDKKSKLESVYNAGLESILGYETSITDSLTSREGMSRSDASSMMAELTALGVKTKGRFEESADGTKFYLNNVTDIMNDLTRTIQDESTNPQQRAAAESLLKQVRYVQEWQPYELADSMGSTIEEMANATEISTIEMRDFYKELTGRDIGVEDAQRLAAELNELDPVARIEQLVAIARQSGIEVEGMEERLAETAANVLDTIIEAISNGMSSIGEGLSGTLSFAGLNELMQKYNLSVQDSFGTASGATLGEQDRRNLITAMYQEAKASGLHIGFGDQLWETFRDSDNNPYAGYNALEGELADARSRVAEAIAQDSQAQQELALAQARRAELVRLGGSGEELTAATEVVAATQEMANNTAQAAEEARAYAEALEQARAAAMFDENAYEFTFMEQDATSGLTKNADNFINQIDTVKAAFQSFKNDESIGYQDFYNMMDFLNNTGQWESFSENVGMAGRDYEDFVNSVVANTDEWGKVDIGGVAAEMGISVDAAMTAMSDSMKSGLIEVAKQQVDYLTGLENMLKAMAALESIGDIGLGISVTIDGQAKTVEEWIASWNDLDEDTKKEFILKMRAEVEDDQLFDWTGVDQGMRDALDIMFGEGFGDSLDSLIFTRNENGGIVDVANTEIARQYMELASAISKASEDSSGEAAQGMAHALQNVQGMYMDRLGYAMGEDGLWRDAQGQLAELTAAQNAELLKLLNDAAKNATPMDIAGFSERYLQALNAGDTRATISNGRTIELNWDGTTTITDANGNPLTPEAVSELNEEEIRRMEAELNQNRADADHYYELIIDAQGRLTYNIIPVGDIGAVLENTPDTITIDDGQGVYRASVVVNTETQTITFNGADGRPLTGEDLQNAMNTYASQMNLSDRGIELSADENGIVTLVPTITAAPSDTEILTQIASDIQAIKDSLVGGFEVTVDDQASSAFDTIWQNYVNLRTDIQNNPIQAGVSITGESPQSFTGTVNNITGPAYADGSIGRLYSGAQLASKTLVGELGPELAVYNGQYHLLGQTGAEFVKLPKSAIVFNHLQTAGILSGQMKDARGLPLTPNAFATGNALVAGNVTGPALAGGGIGAALSAVSRAKSVWQGLLNSLSAADLLDGGGGGGGGGGGNDLKAHIADLQEWYNLSRQIAKIESEINTLLSKRNNLTDGHEYLRNLRETQSLLDDQVDTQKDLLRFQELQLQAQAEHINTNEIWSKFLKVDENGLLQYIEGNETNGGKGALEVLSKMNEMSGEEQLAYVQSLGWSYTTTDGEELEEAELVAKFYEELQKQIDDYDALADTVNETESALEDLEGQINEIEKEIRDNEIDLSQEIYDIIVDAWKENIENLKEQNDLIKEANEAYAQGIEKAISAERELYEQNQSIQEREQMQRQLALLRRSGGSASEIANLEAQLDEKLKEEYFANQEKALEDIREANERQVELMEQQVKIQEEQLKYQEENGVIWSKVYEVMQGTDAEILQFMQGNSTEFFQKSYLQQEDMLTEWAKKIGIYNEEKLRKVYDAEAAASLDDTWASEEGQSLISAFNKAGTEQQQKWLREYRDTYTAAMLNDESEMEAISTAREEMFEHIRHWIEAEEEAARRAAQEAQAAGSEESGGSNNGNGGGNRGQSTEELWKATGRYGNSQGDRTDVAYGSTREEALRNLPHPRSFYNISYGAYQRYAKGGIIDYTGPAWVDGSKSKPERILSAEQTRILEEGLAMNAGRGTKLQEALQGFAYSLGSSIQSSIASVIKDSNNVNAFNIQPGAVVLQIAELNDKYDVDELFNDVADRLYSIAAKSSGRSVSRR